MTCPKCGQRAAYEAQEECGGCGLVFSMWKPGGGAVPSAATAAIPTALEVEKSGVTLELKVAAVLLLSVSAFYLLRTKVGKLHARDPELELNPEVAGGSVKDPCFIEGEVLDIFRLTPVAGARIAFDPKYASVTDEAGKFRVKVTAGIAYDATFTHADFLPAHIDGFSRDWRDALLEERATAARMAAARAAEDGGVPRTKDYKCESGESVKFNFALVPRNLDLD